MNLLDDGLTAPGSTPLQPGQSIDVFVYRDSHCELTATIQHPYAVAGECTCLQVSDIAPAGAFLDWGIRQQILLPVSKQQNPLRLGQKCVVVLELDERTERVIANSKLSQHLPETTDVYQQGDKVELLISGSSAMGFKAVVDGQYLGLLYRDEVFQPLHTGQKLSGYIKALRADQRLDLTLSAGRKSTTDDLGSQILMHLREHGGSSELTDHSAPEAIKQQYQVSKKAYKRALSQLYKDRKILIGKDQIELSEND